MNADEAREAISRTVQQLDAEALPLNLALGRTLREQACARTDLPPMDRSAMDGFAVRCDETSTRLRIMGEIRAGDFSTLRLAPGEAARVHTGAMLPTPDLRVVKQEDVRLQGDVVEIPPTAAEDHVRRRGEEARAGEVLLSAGTLLDAPSLALCATVGAASIQATRLPRIVHLTTGDELVSPEQDPGPGQIRNSNATLIHSLLGEQRLPLIGHWHLPDDPDRLRTIVAKEEIAHCDLLLISGGAGGGSRDFTRNLLRELGYTLPISGLQMRPGKPLLFGARGARCAFGLPGNPVSHLVCFYLFVSHALDRMLGRPPSLLRVRMPFRQGEAKAGGRETFWPVRVVMEEDRMALEAASWKSSGDLTHLTGVAGLVRVPATPSVLGTEMDAWLYRYALSSLGMSHPVTG